MDRDMQNLLKKKATLHSKFYHELSNQTTLNPPNDVNNETCFSNQPQQHKHQQQSHSKHQQPQLVLHLIASDELETVETTVVGNLNLNESPTQAQMKSDYADTSVGCTNEKPHVLTTTERKIDNKMRKRDNTFSNEMTIRERGVCFDGNRLKNNKKNDKSNYSVLSATIRQNCKQQFDNIDSQINNGSVVGGADADGTQFPSVEKLIKMYASLVNDQTPVESQSKKSKMSTTVRENSEIFENNSKTKKDNNPIEVGELEFIEQFDMQMNIGRVQQQRRKSPASDEGFSVQMSPYGSSDEDDGNKYKAAEKVTRSTSSDSALGIEEEAILPMIHEKPVPRRRRATLTVNDIPLRPALLPVALPISLPSGDLLSPTSSDGSSPTVVRSRILLEEQLIEIPSNETDDFDTAPVASTITGGNSYPSRRESTVSDVDGVVRYVRTPSVVLSDYCDEMMGGITLEDLENLRRNRLNRKKSDPENDSDCSAASSCSNLNYCGSTISALDMDYQCEVMDEPQRKISSCSTCSNFTCDEDDEPVKQVKRKVNFITN